MKIRNHRLIDNSNNSIAFVAGPHVGGGIQPRFLVIHYTWCHSKYLASSIETPRR